jgi:hypothetical protein
MSANKAVTVFRSPSLRSVVASRADIEIRDALDSSVARGVERAAAGANLAPHFLQKRAPELTGALHAGHSSSNLCPHCSQKTASAGFSLPQLGQSIYAPNCSSNCFASLRSAVSNPSVNQP